MSRDFQIFAPLSFFEKANAVDGQNRRIAGVISTETLDKQGEVVVQSGLDFRPFQQTGFFNDNHSKDTDSPVGYPTGVSRFQKGERLPDGTVAEVNGTWSEGYLLDTPRANRIWDLGRALSKANDRRLGFSIEGSVKRREGPGGKRVVKAVVRNVAITNCPVGDGTRMELLSKSLQSGQTHLDDETFWEKALTVGASDNAAPVGVKTGEGAGQVLAKESLEQDGKVYLIDPDDDDDDEVAKSVAVSAIRTRFPGCSADFAERAYSTLLKLSQQSLL